MRLWGLYLLASACSKVTVLRIFPLSWVPALSHSRYISTSITRRLLHPRSNPVLRLFRRSPNLFIRQCHLYLPREGGTAIVASTFNHGGLFAEQPDGAISCNLTDIEALGQQIKQKLDKCKYQEAFHYSDSKRSDWPAYKVSSLKTIKSFEGNFIWYSIRGANDANLIWQIASPSFQNGIELHSTISASASSDEIGEWANKFHDFFLRVESIARR